MNALYLTLFVSLVLAAFFVAAFVHGVHRRDHEHHDRLSLMPLDDDAEVRAPVAAAPVNVMKIAKREEEETLDV